MKIVQFKDGVYAVRKGNWLFGYKYLDLALQRRVAWLGAREGVYADCLTPDLEKAKRALVRVNDKGTPIKEGT